jgi:two-component system, cell cycle sensor histidine kinase and response regulator CckA
MQDHDKTREQLIDELSEMRAKVLELEASQAEPVQDGRPAGNVIMTNITGHKQAVDALKFSEEKFYKAFQSSPDPIIITRLSDGKIIDVNEGFCFLSGYSKDEALQSSTVALNVWANIRDRDKLLAGLNDNKTVRDMEFQFRSRSGKIFDCLVSGEIILIGDETHILVVVRDITELKRQERELQDTLRRLYTILSSSHAGLLLVTNENIVEFVNQAMCDLFDIKDSPNTLQGLTAPEMIGKIVDVYARPAEILARIRETVAQNSSIKGEEISLRDGRTCLVDYIPIVIDEKPYGRLWTHTDITDLKQSKAALQESQERLELALKGADLGLWDLDLTTGQGMVNERMLEIVGYSSGEVETSLASWQQFIHPDDIMSVRQRIRAHLEGRTDSVDHEYRIRRKSGEYIWVLARGKVVEHGKDNRPLRMAGTVMDVSAEKRAEEALQNSEQIFRLIVDRSPIAMAVSLGTRHKTQYLNPKFTKLLGYNIEDLPELSDWWLLAYPDENYRNWASAEWNRRIQSALRNQDSVEPMETEVTCKDGSKKIIEWGLFPAGDKSVFFGIDLTQRKQSEQERENLRSQLLQSQKMEAVGTLAAGIAHDFNNMLQVILGFSELLLGDKKKGESGYDELRMIIKTTRDAADLVQKIRIFSRKSDMQPVPLNLNHQVEDVVKLLSRTLPKNVLMDIHLEEELEAINADPSQMSQMLMNLAINADESMPDGGILTIETKNIIIDEGFCRQHFGIKPGPHVLLTVSDTGRGIENEQMDKIFDPFYSTKPRDYKKGTGLGLSVVKGTVEQHKGYLSVESELGKGTAFRIYFPSLITGELPRTTKGIVIPNGGGETILLVEDEEAVREMGVKVLEHVGFKVLTAGDGQEGIDVYKKEQGNISLVLLDILMPRMDGKKCLQELLKINPAVKVLISSGVAKDDLINDVVGLGAKGSLIKPYNMRELLKKVRDVLDAAKSLG